MLLNELRPRWVTDNTDRHGLGLSFYCPCCRSARLVIWFANPLDGGPCYPLEAVPDEKTDPEGAKVARMRNSRWQRTGDNFDSISLAPSVDASESGHWHGFIANGRIE